MNKKHNRLIATARQYALVTFLGLGMSFAVAKTAEDTQRVTNMVEQEWMLDDDLLDPTLPENYSPYTAGPIEALCPDEEDKVCGIKASPDINGLPIISPAHAQRILTGDTGGDDVFMKK